VRVAGASEDRLTKVSFKAAGGVFASMFDGSEQLISLNSVPWDQREIYLPGS
jgi:hypothetical protein